MKRILTSTLFVALMMVGATNYIYAFDLKKATIVYNAADDALVGKMANVLADDIERVSGVRPQVSTKQAKGNNIILATRAKSRLHGELKGKWECYAIDSDKRSIHVTGSDARGLAYGVLHISETIGVSPWYWFADVPVKHQDVVEYSESLVSQEPTIKYRGLFINDEDWGLKTWSSRNFEKELGDIGPKTYDKVCELILRLKGNMLAPAMHSCTGAFYSHPESQQRAAEWGIMITTSHCEPMLFNNASHLEWDKTRDGEWNYETNSKTILQKFDNRLRETARYNNIYTMGMRGLHDEAMKGSKDNKVRARTLEQVFKAQRDILAKYKKKNVTDVPQIFVPYKETLDIYDAGLKVPDDITLVWPDDNYGYMKRVSNSAERARKGHSGVYYHVSYLGGPHDHLWIATTAPMLMYEELKKVYDSGGDRYWLLNVGDIKPSELEMQQFFNMAYDLTAFSYANVNRYQAQWLGTVFGEKLTNDFQFVLDNYYRLAWDRKPEYMGYEMEWDSKENNRLHDTDFSFATGSAQKRLSDYEDICRGYKRISKSVDPSLRPALFEMLGYSVLSSYQMNRKFLYAQRNHETGSSIYAAEAKEAYDSLQTLKDEYNNLLDGKWNQMMSEICPGICAKYQLMPELSDTVTTAYRLPKEQLHPEYANKVDLSSLSVGEGRGEAVFKILEGIGTDWIGLQMGEPMDFSAQGSADIPIPTSSSSDSIHICISMVPMWPVAYDKSNSIRVSFDGANETVCRNAFKEWGDSWKRQVLENRTEFYLTFPVDRTKSQHKLTLTIGDPGQIVQRITYE